MASAHLTPEQRSAIETRDKTLLISAAAGSGKTFTLIERIIHSITDKSNPEDISRMLIVTFTNAAVNELKERVTAAIKAALEKNPNDPWLENQLYALPSARISTIDSFCNDILKNNTDRFGISPRYRIADPTEAKILAHTVWSGLIDSIYRGELTDIATPEVFEELASCLTGVKSDSELEEVLAQLHTKSQSHEDGVEIFTRFAEEIASSADLPIEKNIYASYGIARAKETLGHYASVLRKLAAQLNGGDGGYLDLKIAELKFNAEERKKIEANYSGKQKTQMLSKYKPTYDEKCITVLGNDIALLNAVITAETYSDIKKALDVSFESTPGSKDGKTAVHYAREAMKESVKDLKERYFSYSEDEWREHVVKLSTLTSVLAKLLLEFDKAFFEEKKNRAMLEYSDIERLTYLSLHDENGNPSELALTLQKEFSSVYIDEYQDVNSLQNKIFLAVSRDNNRFTVGDIKQSIYGFRSARPDIFAEMKNLYPSLENSEGSPAASIFMSDNFRCDEEIIDFANAIFDKMFSLSAESIGYVAEDRLRFSKKYEKNEVPGHRLPTVHLFVKQKKKGSDSEDEEDKESADELAPKWTAQKIKELIGKEKLNNGKEIKASDIAIVLRNGGKRITAYADALREHGINARAPEDRDFFLNPEIQLVLCLLNAINNPMKDIFLAGLMLSPVFNFTADELYFAKKIGDRKTLWESVVAYSDSNPENTKFASFISTLKKYRAIAEGVRADVLLMRLYNECGLLALAAKDGSHENLMLLYNYARKFESSSFEGLYNFINYVNTVVESGKEFKSGKETESEDAVTIMTVHKSKGLQFPIVFIGDAATDIVAKKTYRARVVYSEDFGIAMRTRVPGGLALVASPIYNAIMGHNLDMIIREELRVYYVAVTRASERLYITGTLSAKSKEEYIAAQELKKIHCSAHTLREMKTFVDIIHAVDTNAILEWEEKESDTDARLTEDLPAEAQGTEQQDRINGESAESRDENLYNALTSRFSYKYPDAHLTALPEKMSVSNLSPTVLDGTEETPRLTIDGVSRVSYDASVPDEAARQNKRPAVPEFISKSSEHESAKEGIATHNFLQFFDIDKLHLHGADAELDRLCREKFISEDNAKRVNLTEITRFISSDLYRQMRAAKKLYREFRFSVLLPAAMFTAEEKKKIALSNREILLQGVMDCIIEDAGGQLHLVDYKTDRLTKEELADKELARKKLSNAHSAQLFYYAKAIEKIFGKLPDTVRVYSLPLGDTIDV